MKELAQLLNDMCSVGVLTNYALFGAVAQLRYTEPVTTLDADVLVAIPGTPGLDVLGGDYRFCAELVERVRDSIESLRRSSVRQLPHGTAQEDQDAPCDPR